MNISKGNCNSNILRSCVISGYLESLRHLYIYYGGELCKVKLDISETTPENLLVYHVFSCNNDEYYLFWTVKGTESQILDLQNKLIHDFTNKGDKICHAMWRQRKRLWGWWIWRGLTMRNQDYNNNDFIASIIITMVFSFDTALSFIARTA